MKSQVLLNSVRQMLRGCLPSRSMLAGVSMALESKFASSPKLRNCARYDKDHIGRSTYPISDRKGAHIGMIHEALNKWLINTGHGEMSIKGKELDSQEFGIATEKAVVLYKTTKNILNYAKKIDPIIGKGTIDALDKELPKGGFVPPAQEIIIVPFTETAPMLMARQMDDRSKSDLNHTPSEPLLPSNTAGKIAKGLLAGARKTPTFALENDMRLELLAGGKVSVVMGNTFIKNNDPKAVIEFGFGSKLGDAVSSSKEFANVVAETKKQINVGLGAGLSNGVLDYKLLHISKNAIDPILISFHGVQNLKFALGSTQGVRILLENFTTDERRRIFTATVIYEILDHFGADDTDLIPTLSAHGSPGQVALWVMQRERRPGHCPFVSKIMIRTEISDSF
jgi:hypothetical protein